MHEVHETSILAVAERPPLGELDRVEDLGEVARPGQFGPGVEAEHAGAGRGDERRERAGRDVGHQPQRLDVVRMVRPLVVADQGAIGLAAGRAELVLVDLLEQLALVELDRPAEVAVQLALGQVEHAQLERGAGLGVLHQVVQPAPAALELEELRIVHDRVELLRQLGVDRLDGLVERPREVAIEGDGAGQRLLDERLDELLGAIGFGLLGVGDDLIEQTGAASVVVAAADSGALFASAICLFLRLLDAEFARQRLELLLRTQDLLEQVLELLGPIGLAHQIAQLLAGLEQRREGGDLLDDLHRVEVVHRVELEVDRHLRAVVGQLVVDLELEARRHAGHHVVEVVAVDLRELAIGQRLQRPSSDRPRSRP